MMARYVEVFFYLKRHLEADWLQTAFTTKKGLGVAQAFLVLQRVSLNDAVRYASEVALILWMLRSAPAYCSSSVSLMPIVAFNAP